MNNLLSNINKIHTTELGALRIKKNLSLETDEVVGECKRLIQRADRIERRGKNWYVYSKDAVLTLHAGSYTLITAHKNKIKV